MKNHLFLPIISLVLALVLVGCAVRGTDAALPEAVKVTQSLFSIFLN